MSANDRSTKLQLLLNRYLDDQPDAFDELIDYAANRLRALARKMLARYPHVRRWEETDDIMQAALLRLHRSLSEVRPDSKRAFFGLAATQMRRTLIDLGRHYYGTFGLGKNHHSAAGKGNNSSSNIDLSTTNEAQPDDLLQWTRFHESIESLPDEEREVISLVWYGGMVQKDVAELLSISERTVIRRMNRAKLKLNELLEDEAPPT